MDSRLIICSSMAFSILVRFKCRPTIISAKPILHVDSKLQYCMSPSGRACPFNLICVGKAVHAHFTGRGDSRALAIENKAIRTLPLQLLGQTQHTALSAICMHTQDGFAARLRAFESGACCKDRQPTEVSETFRFFSRTAFVS